MELPRMGRQTLGAHPKLLSPIEKLAVLLGHRPWVFQGHPAVLGVF